ncbi:MAG TPA: hypothetical protein VGK19_20055 [Capsulimonadaceae bacterium]|jgi:hypothetical protein
MVEIMEANGVSLVDDDDFVMLAFEEVDECGDLLRYATLTGSNLGDSEIDFEYNDQINSCQIGDIHSVSVSSGIVSFVFDIKANICSGTVESPVNVRIDELCVRFGLDYQELVESTITRILKGRTNPTIN